MSVKKEKPVAVNESINNLYPPGDIDWEDLSAQDQESVIKKNKSYYYNNDAKGLVELWLPYTYKTRGFLSRQKPLVASNCTLLAGAITCGNDDVVQELLRLGANPWLGAIGARQEGWSHSGSALEVWLTGKQLTGRYHSPSWSVAMEEVLRLHIPKRASKDYQIASAGLWSSLLRASAQLGSSGEEQDSRRTIFTHKVKSWNSRGLIELFPKWEKLLPSGELKSQEDKNKASEFLNPLVLAICFQEPLLAHWYLDEVSQVSPEALLPGGCFDSQKKDILINTIGIARGGPRTKSLKNGYKVGPLKSYFGSGHFGSIFWPDKTITDREEVANMQGLFDHWEALCQRSELCSVLLSVEKVASQVDSKALRV